ncbi:MAG: hypothetical protein M1821_006458 [Bathelium mastoideum]|nr:MAG: hypothetical protein M1821_006458 [Bathelium mastoideum]KAI9693733.1 MAG: hypothetical protein M1822_003004 [Bathelium mastoideum]
MADEKPTFGATIEPHASEPTQPRIHINSSPFDDEKQPMPTLTSPSETSTPALTPVASRAELDGSNPPGYASHNPFSAFYAHPSSRHSLDELNCSRNASRSNLHTTASNVTDEKQQQQQPPCPSDLEKGILPRAPQRASVSATNLARPSQDWLRPQEQDPSAWPTKQSLRAKARAMKLERRRQRCWRDGNGKDGHGGRMGASAHWVELQERWRVPKQWKLWVKILIGLLVVAAAVGIGIGVSRAVGGGVWSKSGTKQIGGS